MELLQRFVVTKLLSIAVFGVFETIEQPKTITK